VGGRAGAGPCPCTTLHAGLGGTIVPEEIAILWYPSNSREESETLHKTRSLLLSPMPLLSLPGYESWGGRAHFDAQADPLLARLIIVGGVAIVGPNPSPGLLLPCRGPIVWKDS
jgi:hypothetical protein